ncbi:Estradiol 17-beta-dehydrogenase 11 [Talaromyces islandicus]|uniref:Short-chain dehydrogenase/reductase 3 n=1 Tax=Talaromyces islandicus TaxID=28573 RepID=A0A0U1M4G7_TALIS|nr:Estradiol 17-beta-dehydrogenase 11 [Talaromyces islandicus]
MEASVSLDNKPKTLPPYGPPPPHPPPHPASHPLHRPQPRMLPPSDGPPHHALPTPHAIYDQQWRQPYPHPHYESADQRRHSAGQPHNPPHPPPHPSYPIAQPSRELPQLPPGDPYPRPNSLPAPPPTHSPSDAHPPHTYRPMNGAPPETAPPHSAPGDFRQPRNPYAPPPETPAPHHGEPPAPQYISQMPPPVAQTSSASYDYPFSRQRKAARAQQACDQCRARKAKCDEGRPSCSHCKENSIACVYKEIPPHKQEKATQVLLDRLERLEERMEARFREMFKIFAAHGGVPLAAMEQTKEVIEPGESTPSAQETREVSELSPDLPQNEGATAQKTPKEIKENDTNANDVLMSDVPLDEGSTASESADRVTPSLKGLPAQNLPKANIPLSSLPNSNMALSALPAKSLPNSHLPVNTLPRTGYKNPLMNEIAMKSYRLAEKFEEIINPPPIDEKLIKTDNEELSIPLNHTTAAHKLLSWPSIKRLLESNIDMDYVMKGEENRGLIRVYGCGEGQDDDSEWYDDRKQSIGGSPMTASSSPSFVEEASQPSFPSWGVGLPSVSSNQPAERLPERSGDHHRGGLDASGQLNTHPDTVRDLHRNYMENIHILHPFLDEAVLDHKISNFIKKYGGVKRTPISQSGTGVSEFRSAKRKRSSEAMHVSSAEMSRSPSSHSNFEKYQQPQRIERSIDNAIILLVLALGAICGCKGKIPALIPDANEKKKTEYAASSPSTRAFLNQVLSPDSDTYSPKMSFQSPRLTSDDGAARRKGPMRPPSATGPENPDFSTTLKNMDVIPGLAYYAYATDILGNLQGGSGLLHVQAALLAGLYAGQLAHPFQSYGWIHQASRACMILVRSNKYSAMKEGPIKDLHDFAYWTCLQLESDILAELDLPASGISRNEGRIDLPKGHYTLRVPQNPKNSTMMFFYSAQIHLRKVLNQIHTDLYKVGSDKDDKDNHEKLGFSSSVLEILGMNLDFWRKSLPDHMNWDEDDPPSSDINVARLRAKYYGARYIIYRPLLHYALHQPPDPEEPQQFAESPGHHGPKSEQVGSFSTSTPQSSSMTRWSSDMGIYEGRSDDIHRTIAWDNLPPPIQDACETCINAAIRSTQAFHGIKGRPIVTGIFGTAHAQFGNMLVLSATYMSNLRHLVERDKLEELFLRTIKFLMHSKNVSPTLWQDAQILAGIYRFTADVLGSILKTTVFSPTKTLLAQLLLRYAPPSAFLPQNREPALKWLRIAFALGLLRVINAWLSRRAINRAAADKYDWPRREIVVVTGGSNGFGKQIVLMLAARAKAKIVVLDILEPQYELPEGARFYHCDITSSESIAAAAEKIRADHDGKGPTVLINNAGIIYARPLLDTSEAEIEKMFSVNTLAQYKLVRQFLPPMIENNHGMVVTVASQGGNCTTPGMTAYCASKAANINLHEGLASELVMRYRAPRVRTVLVTPAYAKTFVTRDMDPQNSFVSPLLEPETVAEAVVNQVLSGQSGYVGVSAAADLVTFNLRCLPLWIQSSVRDGLNRTIKTPARLPETVQASFVATTKTAEIIQTGLIRIPPDIVDDGHGLTATRTAAKEQGIRPGAGELVAPADGKPTALVNRDDMAWLVNVPANAAAETEASPVFRVAARAFALKLFGGEGGARAHLEALVAGEVTVVPDMGLSTLSTARKKNFQGEDEHRPCLGGTEIIKFVRVCRRWHLARYNLLKVVTGICQRKPRWTIKTVNYLEMDFNREGQK